MTMALSQQPEATADWRYTGNVNVDTMSPEQVGVRELKNGLSRYLARVKDGQEFIVTDNGRPVARIIPIGGRGDRLDELIARGEARAALPGPRTLPKPVKAKGTVSDLVADQRR
jgi:prevent-host-death family protein